MLRPYGLDTIRPENGVYASTFLYILLFHLFYSSKSVSDGAIIFYLNDLVRKSKVSSDCVILPFYPSPGCGSPPDAVDTYLIAQIVIPRRFFIPRPSVS